VAQFGDLGVLIGWIVCSHLLNLVVLEDDAAFTTGGEIA